MTTENTSKHLGKAWVIWALAAGFYFYEFLLQVSPNVMKSDLMPAFKLDGSDYGYLIAFTSYAYLLMQIPCGVMLDRLGPRRLLVIASLLCAVGCIAFGIAHSFAVAALGRFFIGLGAAFAVISCFRISASWFPHSWFAVMSCLTVTIGMLGAASGGYPVVILIKYMNWRSALLVLGSIGFVLAVLIYLVIRDKPPSNTNPPPSNLYHSKQEPLLSGLWYIVKSKQTWIAAAYGGLMFAPTIAFGQAWSSAFLMKAYDLSLEQAGALLTVLYCGWALGAPFAGWLSDQIGRRKPLMVIGSSCGLVTLSSIIYLPGMPIKLLTICMFCFGLFSSCFLPAFALVKECHTNKSSGTAMGFMNMVNSLGGAVLLPLIGIILDLLWHMGDQKIVNHVHVFTQHSYQIALSTLPLCMLTALMLLPFIKETYCQNQCE